jgi:O-acetylserine/cysteine efflux transporter
LWMDGAPTVWLQLGAMGPGAWLAVAYLAGLATLLAYSLWTSLLKRHPAGRVTPFSLLVPVVGLWAAWVFFDEQPLAQQWLGTAAVLLGLLINQAGALQSLGRGWLERRRAGQSP